MANTPLEIPSRQEILRTFAEFEETAEKTPDDPNLFHPLCERREKRAPGPGGMWRYHIDIGFRVGVETPYLVDFGFPDTPTFEHEAFHRRVVDENQEHIIKGTPGTVTDGKSYLIVPFAHAEDAADFVIKTLNDYQTFIDTET